MARRGKSPKSGGALGIALLALIIAGQAIYTAVMQHLAETGVAVGVIALSAIGWRAMRRRARTQAIANSNRIILNRTTAPLLSGDPPRSSFSAQAPRRADSSERSSDFGGSQGPPVRITPIIDPPRVSVTVSVISGRQRDPHPPNTRWILPGQSVTIQGVKISSGLFYVAANRSSAQSRPENCLINSSLPIASAGSASTEGISYWPSYSGVTPPVRRAFLEWMASGKGDPSTNIGLVFIYFYGLEYRLFKEGVNSDAGALVTEVERLRKIYGANGSVQNYARAFLNVARVLAATPGQSPEISFDGANWQGIPLDVRVHIGSKLAIGEPITAMDALLWAISMPNTWLRKPANRCQDEFKALWSLRYQALYPDGLPVPLITQRISATYAAASGTFEVPVHGDFEDLPDIASDMVCAPKLKELVDLCTNELDPYSRYIGRHPDAIGKLEATLLLPQDLWGVKIDALKSWLTKLMGYEDIKMVTADQLLAAADYSVTPVTNGNLAPTVNRLSSALATIDFAIEPDGSNASAVALETPICVFKAKGGAQGAPESLAERTSRRNRIDIALLAAATAGPLRVAARAAIAACARVEDGVDRIESVRIMAYAMAAQPATAKLSKQLKGLAERPIGERQAVARCALAAVGVTNVPPETVKFMERLYAALKFLADDLYSALHRVQSEPASNSGLRPSSSQPTAEGSTPMLSKPGEVTIDPERLARIQEETHAVSSLLSSVFAQEVEAIRPAPSASVEAATANGSAYPGLDSAHSALVTLLLDQGPLPRAEFDARAKALKLMADGSLEEINEWAFDRFDEPLIEDGDTVMIAAPLRDRILDLKDKAK